MASDTAIIPELEKGIETHGIERVSPAKRSDVRIFNNFTMWLSANLVISTVALGALAIPIFGLGFWDSLAIIILFNVLACIGWSTVNVIVGGQIVASLSHGAIPRWAGILIIAILTTLVSIYGYKYVHRYERYAWIPMAVIFAILFVVGVPKFTIVPTPAMSIATIASLVSFGGAIYGFATGWSSYAADYNVNQPEEVPASRIFWLTFLGVTIPCILLETLGMALTTVAAYKGKSGGDLLAAALQPLGGFGNLLLVLLALSVIANNIPNDYSLGLSMQVLGKSFQRVNRAVWTLIGAVVYIIIAISLAGNFNETLNSFLLLVAYWLGPWSIILILEHFVFRHGRYNVDDWNTRSRLPLGWAAIVSMVIGLFGVFLGAAQVIAIGSTSIPAVGPIANLFNPPYGMDIGFELGLVFAAISYLILRRIELNANGR